MFLELPFPEPQAKADFVVKGWGTRRGEDALIYTIPNRKNPTKPSENGITVSEFEAAFAQLKSSGQFTRAWFNSELPACAGEGSCNFTSIGGIFELLSLARYAGRGVYERV
ncbi:MAG TPA: hypothetical protein P5159_23935 [Phycisphaerae bacterium]|nr:hypothetical protein [Phycisphaerae bacterium]HSA29592.1 hypothetical protein [Phycisphaerae bacterium]